MSDLRMVLQEVLNTLSEDGQWGIGKAKIILKKALEQPQQEPYAWAVEYPKSKPNLMDDLDSATCELSFDDESKLVELYTNPSMVRRISEDEIKKVWLSQYGVTFDELPSLYGFANKIMDACNIPKEGG